MSKNNKISKSPVKGMRDFYPEEMLVRNWLFALWREVAVSFGFEEYDTSIVETEDLFIRKAGDEITEQLYCFEDKGQRRIALRPEMTPSLARMVIAKGKSLSYPLKWFSIPQCFRYEKMQKGRKREHFQWNMDIVGDSSAACEAELMSAQKTFLQKAGFKVTGENPDIKFKVSNRMILEDYMLDLGLSDAAIQQAFVVVDKLGKIGPEATESMLVDLGVPPHLAENIIKLLETKGIHSIAEIVGEKNTGVQKLKELSSLAESFDIANLMEVDLSIVRGLSYYTGTVWELFDTSGEIPRSIAGGGRYDKLLESLGGNPTPMVGFGFGDVVVSLLISERKLLPKLSNGTDILIIPAASSHFGLCSELATKLRVRGENVLVNYSTKKLPSAIKLAERVGAGMIYIVGDQNQESVVTAYDLESKSRKELQLSALMS